MRFSTTLIAISSFVAGVVIAAPTISPDTTTVNLDIFMSEHCAQDRASDAAQMKLLDTKCHPFKKNWGGLKVQQAGKGLKYNSLHIFETEDCSGPWTLEPVMCGGGECACSRITPYKSIRIVLD